MSAHEETAADEVTDLARIRFGLPGIYPYQRGIIDEILKACTSDEQDDRDAPCGRSLILLPTGAGKSLCYMLPCLLIDTLTLILYPLNALISDQLNRFAAAGIPAAALTGGVSGSEKRAILEKAGRKELTALLINPETLLTPAVAAEIARLRPGHVVLDEAHTVAEWGLSFRPAYIEAARMVRGRESFTDQRLYRDRNPEAPALHRLAYLRFRGVQSRLPLTGQREHRLRGDRGTLERGGDCRNSALEEFMSPAIIFCRTRRETERIARCFNGRCGDMDIRFYHAGLERAEKQQLEAWFMRGGDKILCATCAFGLGVDCPGVRTVIHLSPPSSAEAYIQESGRAGRDGKPCRALVLIGAADTEQVTAAGAQKSEEAERAAVRGRELRKAFGNRALCRRSGLMMLFNPEETLPDCGICDVCRGLAPVDPAGQKQITAAVQRFQGLLSPGDTADLLKGYASTGLRVFEGEKSSLLRPSLRLGLRVDTGGDTGAVQNQAHTKRGASIGPPPAIRSRLRETATCCECPASLLPWPS